MKNLIYPDTCLDHLTTTLVYCITIHCVKSNCFPTNTRQSQLVPSIIRCTLTLVYCYIPLVPPINFVESPNDIDFYAPYLFLDISIQKSYSSASLICHAHLLVMYLPENSNHVSVYLPHGRKQVPCSIFQIYYARHTSMTTPVLQYKLSVSASINIIKNTVTIRFCAGSASLPGKFLYTGISTTTFRISIDVYSHHSPHSAASRYGFQYR